MKSLKRFKMMRVKKVKQVGSYKLTETAIDLRSKTAWITIAALIVLIIIAFNLRKSPIYIARQPAITSVLVNPLIGWAPSVAISNELGIDHTLVHAQLTWNDFEPQEGVYDFAAFEEKNNLQALWRSGKRLILRFVLDSPSKTSQMDIPYWLYQKIGNVGEWYSGESGSGYNPDYSNPYLEEKFIEAANALGKHYNDDALVAYIETGAIGHNGLWSVGQGLRVPTDDECIRYSSHLAAAFPSKRTLLPKPLSQDKTSKVGIYIPTLGDSDSTQLLLDDIFESDTPNAAAIWDASMLWKNAPIGASFLSDHNIEDALSTDLAATILQLTNIHLSYIVPTQINEALLSEESLHAVETITSLLGYRLRVKSASWRQRVRQGYRLYVDMTWLNEGVAPMYQDWPVVLSLMDGESIVCTGKVELKTSSLLPGEKKINTWIDIPSAQKRGKYKLYIAIFDPVTQRPAVHLAMEGGNDELYYELGPVEIK